MKNGKHRLGSHKWQYHLKGVLSNSSAMLNTGNVFPKDVDHFWHTFVLLERCWPLGDNPDKSLDEHVTVSCQDIMAVVDGCCLLEVKEDSCGVLPVVFKHAKVWCREEEIGFILHKRKWDEIIVRKNWYLEKFLKSSFLIIHGGQLWNRLSSLWLEPIKKRNDKM